MDGIIGAVGLPSAAPRTRSATAPEDLRRGRRVVILILAVIVMSVVDLALTLTYVTSVGMVEVNPVARHIMTYNSPLLVGGWKLLTLGVGLGILLRFRHTRPGEIGAWVSLGLLVWLMHHWMLYNRQIELAAVDTHMSDLRESPAFVAMDPDRGP